MLIAFQPPITLQKTQSVVAPPKSLATSAQCLMKPKEYQLNVTRPSPSGWGLGTRLAPLGSGHLWTINLCLLWFIYNLIYKLTPSFPMYNFNSFLPHNVIHKLTPSFPMYNFNSFLPHNVIHKLTPSFIAMQHSSVLSVQCTMQQF